MPTRSSIGAFRVMRRIDQYLGPPACFALAVARRVAGALTGRRPAPPAGGPRKILAIKFWGMGSIVLITPALRALKKTYPQSHITFVTFAPNEGVCRLIGSIDRVYAYRADGSAQFLRSLIELVRFLRRERFDAVIDFEFFSNFTSLVTALSGAGTTVGFRSPKFWRESFYATRVAFTPAHITENFLNAARALGAAADGAHLDALRADHAAPAPLLAAGRRDLGRRVICINVNASSLDYKRRWPLRSYRELIRRLLDTFADVTVVLIGSREEAAYVAELTASLPPGPNLVDACGMLSVDQLVALLQRSLLFIGNDSGPLHLAAAAGIPTVSFFGPETPALYGPRGDAHTVLYKGIACSPCLNVYNSKDNSFCRDNVCMKSIGVDEAWAAVCARVTGRAGRRVLELAGGSR